MIRNNDDHLAITPLIYLETDLTLDQEGFHHIVASSGYEAIISFTGKGGDAEAHHRFLNEVAYEVIAFAVNDQPITFRASVGGGYRDDLVAANGWEFKAGVGLRASIWAPARDIKAMDKAEALKNPKAM